MSIKSINIDFNLIPTPPIGYSYIGTDLTGNLVLKLDSGLVVYPEGVTELANLTDVNVSGKTIGQVLSWNGSKWINTDVVTDLTNYYTSGQTNTAISNAVSTETSSRISGDQSLSTGISTIGSSNVVLSTGLSGALTGVTSLSSSLSTTNSTATILSTGISTETSSRISGDQSLSTGISTLTSTDTILSTGISTETSNRIVGDQSLSTNISTLSSTDVVLSSSISTLSSNNVILSSNISSITTGLTSLSSNVSTLTSTDTILSTGISTETSNRIVGDNSISTGLSSEISTRTSYDIVLSTAIQNIIISGASFDPTSLSNVISTETSNRVVGDNSLSTSISTTNSTNVVQSTNISGSLTGITSLSTGLSTTNSNVVVLSTGLSTTNSTAVILSTGLSSEISSRTSSDTSLSTSVLNKVNVNSTPLGRSKITSNDNAVLIESQIASNYQYINVAPGNGAIYLGSSTDSGVTIGNIYIGATQHGSSVPIKYNTDLASDYDDRTLVDRGYTNSISTAISTRISTEISNRVSGDNSLSTSVSTETSSRISGDNLLSTGISGSLTGITSLSTGLSTTNSTAVVLSTGLSTEISNRIVGDNSLSTRISGTLTGVTSLSTGLSTTNSTAVVLSSGISTEISNRIVGDNSLSTFAQQPWIDINRCGFVDNTQTTINFDSSTRTFTLTGITDWSYYRGGIKHTISGSKSIVLPTTANTYFIKINNTTGTLESGTTSWTLEDQTIPVVTIRYNSLYTPSYLMADERHTCLIDRKMHQYEHLTAGTQFVSGGVLNGPTLTPAVPTDITNTFGFVGVSIIADEDLFLTIPEFNRPSGTTNSYLHFVRTGTTDYFWKLDNMPYFSGVTGYIQYDASLTGILTTGRDNRWYNCYVLASNVKDNGFAIFQGRGEFTSLALAQAENPLTFSLTGLPIVEGVIMYQFTWQTNNTYTNKGKCRLAATPRSINVPATGIVGSGAGTDHNTLAGLQGGDGSTNFYHLTNTNYLEITGITSTLSTIVSDRISGDLSLSTGISTNSSTAVVLSSGLSTEISNRIVGDNSLSTSISTLGSTDVILSTDISGSLTGITSLSSSISTLGSTDVVLSTGISTETSNRISSDISLSTLISSLPTGGTAYDDTSISTALSTETSNRIVGDNSLSTNVSGALTGITSLSTSISTLSSTDIILSTAISTNNSSRISGDQSLSTLISSLPTGGTSYDDTSISTALSTETSNRVVADYSLSTAISGLGPGTPVSLTGLTDVQVVNVADKDFMVYSGGTNKWSNHAPVDITYNIQNGDLFYLSGTTLSGTTYPYVQIVTSGSSRTLQSTDHGKVLEFTDNATVTLPNGLKNGFQCVIMNMGVGKTITLSATTTLYSAGSKVTITTEYAGASVYHKGGNVWVAMGNLV